MSSPLLSLDSCVLVGAPGLSSSTFQADSEHLVIRQTPGVDGAKVLLEAFVTPTLVAAGSISVLGRSVADGLADGTLGYVPRSWPERNHLKTHEALTLGAHLLGLGKSDVAAALSLTRTESAAKRRVQDLSLLETRLVGLAHGLISRPQVLLIPDPFLGLSEPDAELFELILEPILERTRVIASLEADTLYGRRFEERLGARAMVVGATLVGPLPIRAEEPGGMWVRVSGDAGMLSEHLERAGAKVYPTPRGDMLLVTAARGLTILRAAQECDARVLELTPVHPPSSWASAE